MARKKIQTTVYLTTKQWKELKAISAKTRVPWSVYLRDGVELILAKLRKRAPA